LALAGAHLAAGGTRSARLAVSQRPGDRPRQPMDRIPPISAQSMAELAKWPSWQRLLAVQGFQGSSGWSICSRRACSRKSVSTS